MNKVIILMRHGTAKKNIEDTHGGLGSGLVDIGKAEVIQTAKSLLNLSIPIKKIYYVNRKQCLESAEILSSSMQLPSEQLLDIEPFHLGILDGLSEKQADDLYPDVSSRMKLWRNGEIDITELTIPEASDPAKFYDDSRDVLINLSEDILIIVGTRSLLVAFASVLLGREPIKNGGYVEIPWKNSAYSVFNLTKERYELDNSISTNHII